MYHIDGQPTINNEVFFKALRKHYFYGASIPRETTSELTDYTIPQIIDIGREVVNFSHLNNTPAAGALYSRLELFTLYTMKSFEPVVPRKSQGPALKAAIDYAHTIIARTELLTRDVTIAAYRGDRRFAFDFVGFVDGKPPHRERKRKLKDAAIAVSLPTVFLQLLTTLAQHGDDVAAALLRVLTIPDRPLVEEPEPGVVKADLGPALKGMAPRREHAPKFVPPDLHLFRLAQLEALRPRAED
jgi:hypothetical protein